MLPTSLIDYYLPLLLIIDGLNKTLSPQSSSFYPHNVNLSNVGKSFLIAGEYHLYVEDIQFDRFNEFECQVSPDHQNQHEALRARAFLNVLGRYPPDIQGKLEGGRNWL